MGAGKLLIFLLQHPLDLSTFVQFYWHYHRNLRQTAWKEHPNSGWDRDTMKKCWELLEMTDKDFCAAAKVLDDGDGDLARTIAIFCVVLRAVDTIEDDMTLPDTVKQSILRSFHINTVTPGWKFNGCDPNMRGWQLLVEYDNVVEEVNLLSPQCKDILVDLVLKTAINMADNSHKATTTGSIYVETVAEYDRYCRNTLGIFIEAISQIFSICGKESPPSSTRLELSNSVGRFLQKADIIGDYREDVDQQRYLWPREIWGREKYGFKEMAEMHNTDPDTVRRATYVQSEMILDALQHVTDGLDYLRPLQNRSVFNSSATIAIVALANLELCFMNEETFQRKVEIRKVDAAKLIMRATNMREVTLIVLEYTRKILAKADRSDPNFIGISMVCGKIEEWCEQYCDETS